MSESSPPYETLPEDVLLALRANVMILLVNRHDTVTSTDVVAEVLRSLDANGYDLVRRPDENAQSSSGDGDA